MKFSSSLRLAALPLALSAAIPALAQSQLAPVVVTATRFADAAESLPMGVSVITAEEIRAAGVTTVNEAVVRLLGVVGRQDFYGGGEYALDLRGFGETAGSNQVLIVDGVRINEADLSAARLSGIPIESVEKIEVLRGSGAVLYGEGATGGVIIVTTKGGVGKERQNSASVYAGAGTFGLREARANATLASGGFSLDVSTMKRESDNHRDNFHSTTEGSSLAGQWSNDWLRLGARYSTDQLDTRLPGSLNAANYAANPRQSSTPNDHASIDNTRQTVFAEALLGDWQLAADAGRRTRHTQSFMWGTLAVFDVEASQYSLRARHATEISGHMNQFVVGMDHSQWDLNSTYGPGHQSSNAVYIKDDLTLSQSGTRLSSGLRTAQIDKDTTSSFSSITQSITNRQNAWELGVSQPWGRDVTSYGRVGRSFRLVNIDELPCYGEPCANLNPQTSRDIELGTRWNYAIAGQAGKVDARVYRSLLNGEIGFDPISYTNVNYDPTLREGVELDASQSVTNTLALRAIAGLREAKFRSGPSAGKDVPLAPKRTLTVRADWSPAAGHKVVGGVNWVASQRPGGDFDNACRMPSYTTADVRYAYQWQRAELALGVTNLFDSKYYTQAYSCVAGVTNGIYPEAGRAFVASARMTF